MSRASSGIVYGITLDPAGVNAGVAAAEATLTAHVARMNALQISIPVGLELTAFTAQAATVDAALARWAAGVNIPINIGGIGGGVGVGTTVNNVSIDNSVVNNLNSTVNNAVTNLLNTISNTIDNTVNNVVNNNAGGGGGGGRGGGWGGGGMRGLGRFLAPYAFIREAEQVIRNEGAYAEAMDAATTQQDEIKAQIKHRTSYDSFAFGIGRLGRAAREAAAPITGEATTEDLEREDRETERREQRSRQMQDSLRFARTVGREFRVATSGEGYSREQQEAKEAKDENEQKVLEERNKAAAPIQAAYEKQMGDIRAAENKVEEARKQRGYPFNVPSPDAGLPSGMIPWTDAQGNKTYVRAADLEAQAKADRDKLIDPIDKQAEQQRKDYERVNAVKVEQANRHADEHRDAQEVERRKNEAILRGVDPAQADLDARRETDAANARKYGRTLRPDDAAASTAADKSKTDVEEDQVRREREGKEAESAERITELRSRANERRLADEGRTEEAALARFLDGWDQRIAKMRDEVNQAVKGSEEQHRRQAELDEAEKARAEETASFLDRQKRERKERNDKFAVEMAEDSQRVDRTKAGTEELTLRAADKTYQAGEVSFAAAQQAKVDAAKDVVAKAKAELDARADTGSPEWMKAWSRWRAAWDQETATVDQTFAAQDERRAQQAKQVREMDFSTHEKELRYGGKGQTAEIEDIRHKADEAFKQAEGNPDLQAAIRRGEAADLKTLERQLDIRASGTRAQNIDGISRTDLLGTYAGSKDVGKETLATLKGEIQKTLQDIAANTKNLQAKTTK